MAARKRRRKAGGKSPKKERGRAPWSPGLIAVLAGVVTVPLGVVVAALLVAGHSAPRSTAAPPTSGRGQTQSSVDPARDKGTRCYGTTYPDRPPIDPDDPVFSDGSWSNAMVRQAFANAKQQKLPAYDAYRAALEVGDALECAFCSCGCSVGAGHRSAADCFKDMHGFGCPLCQKIALRAESLVRRGLSEEQIKRDLTQEFPRK